MFAQFKNKLRIISASAEEQSLKFSIKVVNKTFCCILIHVQLQLSAAALAQIKTSHSLFNKLA